MAYFERPKHPLKVEEHIDMLKNKNKWAVLIGFFSMLCIGIYTWLLPWYFGYSQETQIRKFVNKVRAHPNVQSVEFNIFSLYFYENGPLFDLKIISSNQNTYVFVVILREGEAIMSKTSLDKVNGYTIKCVNNSSEVNFEVFEDYKHLKTFPTVMDFSDFMEQEVGIATYIEENFEIVGGNFDPTSMKREERLYCVRTS